VRPQGIMTSWQPNGPLFSRDDEIFKSVGFGNIADTFQFDFALSRRLGSLPCVRYFTNVQSRDVSEPIDSQLRIHSCQSLTAYSETSKDLLE